MQKRHEWHIPSVEFTRSLRSVSSSTLLVSPTAILFLLSSIARLTIGSISACTSCRCGCNLSSHISNKGQTSTKRARWRSTICDCASAFANFWEESRFDCASRRKCAEFLGYGMDEERERTSWPNKNSVAQSSVNLAAMSYQLFEFDRYDSAECIPGGQWHNLGRISLGAYRWPSLHADQNCQSH